MDAKKSPKQKQKKLYRARYREIISTIAAFGFTDIAGKFAPWFPLMHPGIQKGAAIPPGSDIQKTEKNGRVRLLLEKLGPTFIKLGQLLSGRPDIVDESLARELEKLQDSVPPFPGEQAIAIIEAELGKPVKELFASFDPVPLASASVAQVHRAVLNNGTPAAVKVLRPGIEQTVSLDIEILKNLARFAEKHIKILCHFQPAALINSFSDALSKELNFSNEIQNLERFTNTFSREKNLRIPRFYKYLSSRRVFVMEYIPGVKISAIWTGGSAAAALYNCSPELLADRFVTIILHQIFAAGFFHGDPHPGNVMVVENNTICFLDFGVMGSITGQQKEYFINMLTSIPSGNMRRFTRSLLSLVGIEQTNRFAELMNKCTVIIDTYMGGTLADIRLTSLIMDILNLIISFDMKLPPNITLMAKSLTAIESIALNLNPSFNILEKLTPLIKRLTIEELSAKKTAGKALSSALAYTELLRDLPETSRELLSTITSGKLGMSVNMDGMDTFTKAVNSGSDRLVFGLVLAAVIISSAMLVCAQIPPLWHGISFFGFSGFVLSAVLGVISFASRLIRHLFGK